jgi:hypothetical protein
VRFALRGEPSTLDPHRGASGTDHMSLYLLYDTLVRFDPNMNAQPGLAEAWETPEPKTLVFMPGMAILLTTLAFNFVGDGLREALDPRGKTRGASWSRTYVSSPRH